jgi:hypothetical protein
MCLEGVEADQPPARLEADLACVLDQDEPFFWLADTAWELFHRLDQVEAKLYLDKRAAQGFNVVFVVVL